MKDNDKTGIHLRWMIAILVLITIFIIAFRAKNDSEVINFVSFAATLSSILLSIIAIVYTFITSNAGSTINENMINISDKLLCQTEELNNVYQKINTITCAIPEKLDQISSTFNETAKLFQNGTSETKKPDRGIIANIDIIISNSPLLGYLLFYCLNLISQNNTAVDISKIGDICNSIWKSDHNTDYINGFYKSLRSIGVIYFEDNENIFYNFEFFGNDFSIFSKEKVLAKAVLCYKNITPEKEVILKDAFLSLLSNIDKVCSK